MYLWEVFSFLNFRNPYFRFVLPPRQIIIILFCATQYSSPLFSLLGSSSFLSKFLIESFFVIFSIGVLRVTVTLLSIHDHHFVTNTLLSCMWSCWWGSPGGLYMSICPLLAESAPLGLCPVTSVVSLSLKLSTHGQVFSLPCPRRPSGWDTEVESSRNGSAGSAVVGRFLVPCLGCDLTTLQVHRMLSTWIHWGPGTKHQQTSLSICF